MSSHKFLLLGMLNYFIKNDRFSYLIEDYKWFYQNKKNKNLSITGFSYFNNLLSNVLSFLKLHKLYWVRYYFIKWRAFLKFWFFFPENFLRHIYV